MDIGFKTRGWSQLVVGYTLVTAGLLLDLPTIGASGTSVMVSVSIGALIAIGILLGAVGMLRIRAALPGAKEGARRALALQGAGLIALLFGVLALQISSSIMVLLVSAALVAGAAAMGMVGVSLLRKHRFEVGIQNVAHVDYQVLGMALVFAGVLVIVASKLGYYYLLPDVASTVVNDVGAAISACGCVLAAYSSFLMRGMNELQPAKTLSARRRISSAG